MDEPLKAVCDHSIFVGRLGLEWKLVIFTVYLYSQCGWTVVHFAAYNGHLEMLQELLERFNCEADKRDKKVGLLAGLVSRSQLQCHNYIITIKQRKSHCLHAHIVH